MPHVSKKELSGEQFKELFGELVRAIDSLSTRKKKNNFLWDFLTPTEKIMLSKRLAVIALLEAGVSHYEIWSRLNMSSSTISRIAKVHDRGGYTNLVKNINADAPGLFDIVDSILTVGGIMPRYAGKRWRH